MTIGVDAVDVGKTNTAAVGRLPACYVNKVGNPHQTFQGVWEISPTMKVLHQGICYRSLDLYRLLVIFRCYSFLPLALAHDHVPGDFLNM